MNELLKEIEYNNGKFPEAQLKEIINRKEEFIPELLEVLKNAKENYGEILEKPNYFAHIYAIFLLAQFKEKQSIEPIIDLISLPNEISDDIFGDFLTEDLHKILASVCGSDMDPIKRLVEDSSVNEYVRSAAIKSFIVLLGEGVISQSEVIEYYKSLFEEKLEREFSQVWNELIYDSCEAGPSELYEHIKKAYKDGLIDEECISLEEVDGAIKIHDKEKFPKLKEEGYSFLKDTIEELGCWRCFPRESIESKSQYMLGINKMNKNKNKKKQVKATKKKQRKK
ncbi:DUF1186 family protein [Clostridium sp. CF011]|uniref:DUF1186 domain-containing protein n=1 Tax=unclassified Clostridium TaxID=2614128 RepID=UPI001C0B9EDC|nr:MULTISPECIES: DUF1186 domain-containing protein [unclassified Clostridium]MBU3092414.1 DUF1186 family protein [Clostridium sp. CF011]MBW9146042.1 DUF1186 family protein [Clostridium sp. CM027]UVE39511.1 DUF1186 family protein [Clostridium sp. CM027]WAG68425.1 DUF1186 family protein [Clostridium sp. CF011]